MNLLARFKSARNTRATAYMTSNLEYQPMQFDNTQLQLVESRKAMQTMVAQMMNVPAYLLDAETGGSLTYNNAEGQKRYLVDFSLRNIITVLENRLSMDDITIMGQHVRFDLDDFLRGNPTERAAFYRDVVPLGILTVDEARAMEDLSPAPRRTNGD
jgi:HK97 family phage portal protein